MARVSYDVDQDPVEPHEVKPIPPQEVHIPEAPKSILEGGSIGGDSNGFPPAYNPFNSPTPPGTVYGPGDDNYGRDKKFDASKLPSSMFGAILHKAWEKGVGADSIVGYWAEDNSTYDITVPPQLRDLIITMQNMLCRKYMLVQELEHKLNEARRQFMGLFGS